MFSPYAEFARNLNRAYEELLREVSSNVGGWAIKYISQETGIAIEELTALINAKKNNQPREIKTPKWFGHGFSVIVTAVSGLAFYFSFSGQAVLNSLILTRLTSLFGSSAVSGPGLFGAGAIAIALLIGIITLQRVFLNRIHTARRTGEALSLFVAGADRSLKGFVKVLVDVGYIVSNVLTSVSILGTIGALVFAVSMDLPLILIATPAFASIGLTLAVMTTILGRRHLGEMESLSMGKGQRFISGVISGSVIASIVTFIATTTAVAIPIAIITGIGLGAGAIIGMYMLPRILANDKVVDYRTVFAGLALGALLYTGLVSAFSLGIITVPAAMLVSKYAFNFNLSATLQHRITSCLK